MCSRVPLEGICRDRHPEPPPVLDQGAPLVKRPYPHHTPGEHPPGAKSPEGDAQDGSGVVGDVRILQHESGRGRL
jgi:hypothetical protein